MKDQEDMAPVSEPSHTPDALPAEKPKNKPVRRRARRRRPRKNRPVPLSGVPNLFGASSYVRKHWVCTKIITCAGWIPLIAASARYTRSVWNIRIVSWRAASGSGMMEVVIFVRPDYAAYIRDYSEDFFASREDYAIWEIEGEADRTLENLGFLKWEDSDRVINLI